MERLRATVERIDTPSGRRFALMIQSLILISLVSFSIETIPDLPSGTSRALGWIEAVTVAIFTAEYVLRLAVAQKKTRFIFSIYGLIDLAAILPFYLTTGLDLRALRSLRFLRLFRLLKMVRYSAAIQRFRRALALARAELTLFFVVTALLLYLAAVGIYYFERGAQPEAFSSVFDGLWWAVATLTTVGYGDVFPVTVGGRLFTFFVLMIGLGIIAVPAGIVASTLGEARREQESGEIPQADEATVLTS